MKTAKNILLALTAGFFIIGVHQTITLGFEVSYWIFMLSISMYFTYRLVGSTEREKTKPAKSSAKTNVEKKDKSKKKKNKKDIASMNRQAKRHMERLGIK